MLTTATIHAHSIGDGLDSFRAIFQSSFPDLNPTNVSRFDEQLISDRDERDPASALYADDDVLGRMVANQLLLSLQRLSSSDRNSLPECGIKLSLWI